MRGDKAPRHGGDLSLVDPVPSKQIAVASARTELELHAIALVNGHKVARRTGHSDLVTQLG